MGQEGREEVAPRGDEDADQHAAFLAAIRAEPREPLHRLAYADWLEERGDPRAEYFRVEAALADQDATGHDPVLWEQWVELRCNFEPEWMDAIPRLFRPTRQELVEEFWAFPCEGHILFGLRNGDYLEGCYGKQLATGWVGASASWSEEEARWVHIVKPPRATLKRPWWKFW